VTLLSAIVFMLKINLHCTVSICIYAYVHKISVSLAFVFKFIITYSMYCKISVYSYDLILTVLSTLLFMLMVT